MSILIANLEGAHINWMNLQDAELKGITKYNFSYLHGTAWWEVKSIDKPFLDYLIATNPFRLGQRYGPQNEIPTQEAYDAAIRRLISQLK